MADLKLSMTCGPYDRAQALIDGTVKPQGIELTVTVNDDDVDRQVKCQRGLFDVAEFFTGTYIGDLPRNGALCPEDWQPRPASRAARLELRPEERRRRVEDCLGARRAMSRCLHSRLSSESVIQSDKRCDGRDESSLRQRYADIGVEDPCVGEVPLEAWNRGDGLER